MGRSYEFSEHGFIEMGAPQCLRREGHRTHGGASMIIGRVYWGSGVGRGGAGDGIGEHLDESMEDSGREGRVSEKGKKRRMKS